MLQRLPELLHKRALDNSLIIKRKRKKKKKKALKLGSVLSLMPNSHDCKRGRGTKANQNTREGSFFSELEGKRHSDAANVLRINRIIICAEGFWEGGGAKEKSVPLLGLVTSDQNIGGEHPQLSSTPLPQQKNH